MSDPASALRALPSLGSPASAGDPLTLPDAWTPPPRPGVPLVAALVPVAGAVVMWAVTGSALSLWLAALGPLLAVASLLDGLRGSRSDRRRALAAAGRARRAAADEVDRRHRAEREGRWARHPDLARLLSEGRDIWRAPATSGPLLLVLGAGETDSEVRVRGGAGDEESERLRLRACRLADAPVIVAADAGIAVTGDPFAAAAVVRALALQACLILPPGELRLVGRLAEHEWAERMPHRRAAAGRALAVLAPGEPAPVAADLVLAHVREGHPPPPGCGVHLHVRGLTDGEADVQGQVQPVRVEAAGAAQALAIAEWLDERANTAFGGAADRTPVVFAVAEAEAEAVSGTGLSALIGVGDGGSVVVDLVADGPHAVVAGVTGSGKSELLITWILAMCAGRSTDEVTFLLADFKGGTAFDGLTALPHVTGVITDLDGSGARRAIESLRAEIRWREATLADAGARDIGDPRAAFPRLVIVVDEFAALMSAQPELHAIFGDVAARGRALGMHLILGTQRVAGVVRDSLLANCPLRLSLRVTDRADSRAVIGSDAAAGIPGGPSGRGVAMVRRAGDGEPGRVRIALTSPGDVVAVASRAGGPPPRRPWVPELPRVVRLTELDPAECPGRLILGLADEPERQRQRAAGIALSERGVLVVGGAGSGRTTALEVLASQARSVVRIGGQPEGAWDTCLALEHDPPRTGCVVVADDLDALLGRFPPEYGQDLSERLERIVRGAGQHGMLILVSTQRLTGAVARIAELLPRRLLLGGASRADHFAAGGEPAWFAAAGPPGRGHLDRVPVQVALCPPPAPLPPARPVPWSPTTALTGLVSRRSPAAREAQRVWTAGGRSILGVEQFAAHGHPGSPAVVVGDPDEWQRHWRVLAEIRADHDLVIDASCAAELRLLTGSRALPPYAEPGCGRAWLFAAGDEPVRITLPAAPAG